MSVHFQTPECYQLYEDIREWSHPEHPFLDPHYSANSYAPAIDLTPYVAAWLAAGRKEAIAELWSFLSYSGDASQAALRQALRASVPEWLNLSDAASCELRAIYILMMRTTMTGHRSAEKIGVDLAATTLASRQLDVAPAHIPQLLSVVESEIDTNNVPGSVYGKQKAASLALEKSMSPLGVAEASAEKLKVVPPISRLVVYDFFNRNWGSGLRFDLYYGERMYGCGGKWNQHYVEWLGFFGPADDQTEPPSAVTKDILLAALAKHGITSKKSATKKALVEQARTIPGLLSSVITQTCPRATTDPSGMACVCSGMGAPGNVC